MLEQSQLPLPEQTTFLGLWSYPGTLYLVKGLALEMHEQLRLHFLNGVHFVITEENTGWDLVYLGLKNGLTLWNLLFTVELTEDKKKQSFPHNYSFKSEIYPYQRKLPDFVANVIQNMLSNDKGIASVAEQDKILP